MQTNNSVPSLHLHSVADVEFVDEEVVFDARSSFRGKLVDGGLKFVAEAFDHVAADEEAGSVGTH